MNFNIQDFVESLFFLYLRISDTLDNITLSWIRSSGLGHEVKRIKIEKSIVNFNIFIIIIGFCKYTEY